EIPHRIPTIHLMIQPASMDGAGHNTTRTAMSLYSYPPLQSVFITADQAIAFNGGTSLADSLILSSGAYLISQHGIAAKLDGLGAWSVSVNGSIFGDVGILVDTA